MSNRKYDILAYYFPNWHKDPRNDVWHGKGWTEWEVVKCARPRFEGHDQPLVPLWGYLDESDPNVMEMKINTALQHGIDGFIWDLYWFEDGGYRMDALDKGFFGAKNNEQMKIGLMWCNHDPIYAHPATRIRPNDPLASGDISMEGFIRATDHFIKNYFWRPNYLRVDNKIFFSFYNPQKLVAGLGGLEETRKVIEDFRERVRSAGLGELYISACIQLMPGESKQILDEFANGIGIDGFNQYGWPTDKTNFPKEEFSKFVDEGIKTFDMWNNLTDLPYSPTVSTGWDCSPRTLQSEIYEDIGWPWSTVAVNKNSEDFERGLQAAKDFAESDRFKGSFISLSCWNEWTEGSYLEPDIKHGYAFLEKVKKVFG